MTTDQPRVGDTITDPVVLDDMPQGSVVLGKDHRAYEYRDFGMWHRSERLGGTVSHYVVPARVLYVPGEQPSPSVEDARAEAERKAREEHWCGDPAVFVAGAEWAASRAVPSDQDEPCAFCHTRPAVGATPGDGYRICDECAEPEPAVPSDHTATTEDAIRAVAVEDVIRPIRSALLDTWGTSLKTGRRTMAADKADGIIRFVIRELGLAGLLATARPDTTTEWGVRGWRGIPEGIWYALDEAHARGEIDRYDTGTLVRREVTAWAEAD